MRIEYHIKSVYGNEQIYITETSVANAVTTLTQKKTINNRDIAALIVLGHDVVHVPLR